MTPFFSECSQWQVAAAECGRAMSVAARHVGVSLAIRVFNVWLRMRILATRVVGENTSGVLSTIFVCSVGMLVYSANQIAELLISRVKNVISMKRSARR